MRRHRLMRISAAAALALALAAPLGGCVAYPSYPAYGGYAYGPSYAYPCCVAVGGGYWHGGYWHGGGGGWYAGGGGGWHH